MPDPLGRQRCLACGRQCHYVEDESGGDWETVVPWGRNKRRTCRHGQGPYYAHRFTTQTNNRRQSEVEA